MGLCQHSDATGRAPEHIDLGTIGGAAAPRAMIERLMRMGVLVNHAWGMTETSPIGTMGARGPDWDDLSFEQQLDQVSKQGRVPFGVELRIVDDTGVVLPRDGVSAGRLEVRGPWVVKRYFRDDSGDCLDEDRKSTRLNSSH